MQEHEINIDLELTDEQEVRCEMHSINNVVNVITMQLNFLEKLFEKENIFKDEIDTCIKVIKSFKHREEAIKNVEKLEHFGHHLIESFNTVRETHTCREGYEEFIEEAAENLNSIVAVIEVRVKEILARQKAPGAWIKVPASELKEQLLDVLKAIALNHQVSSELHSENGQQKVMQDFEYDITMEGSADGFIRLPDAFRDTIRDLTANARKYSAPRGKVEVKLFDAEDEISFTVTDNGRGIPGDEVESVVSYGIRGSNTKTQETKGGGFGLTKAYLIARQHDGRMWISTGEGEGTSVKISIPVPNGLVL